MFLKFLYLVYIIVTFTFYLFSMQGALNHFYIKTCIAPNKMIHEISFKGSNPFVIGVGWEIRLFHLILLTLVDGRIMGKSIVYIKYVENDI